MTHSWRLTQHLAGRGNGLRSLPRRKTFTLARPKVIALPTSFVTGGIKTFQHSYNRLFNCFLHSMIDDVSATLTQLKLTSRKVSSKAGYHNVDVKS